MINNEVCADRIKFYLFALAAFLAFRSLFALEKDKKKKRSKVTPIFFEVAVIYEWFGGEQKSPTALHLQVTFAAWV